MSVSVKTFVVSDNDTDGSAAVLLWLWEIHVSILAEDVKRVAG